jgi:hypothetical protein
MYSFRPHFFVCNEAVSPRRSEQRRSLRPRPTITLAALFGTAALLAAQDPAPPGDVPAPVRLDMVVVDRMGHAVLGLQAVDFEVREDGARRQIASVEFRRRGGVEVVTRTVRGASRRGRKGRRNGR